MKELTLKLDGTSPDKLTMSRLAEYLRELAVLYGSVEQVHFDRVAPGSADLKSGVLESAHSEVVLRVREAHQGVGQKKAVLAFNRLGELMVEDRVVGSILSDGSVIAQFPSVNKRSDPLIIFEEGSVQGYLYNIGGKDETVPVRLEGANEESLNCETTTEVAQALAKHLFSYIRVHGKGEWIRKDEGGWRLRKLWIKSYEPLSDGSLRETADKLLGLGQTGWESMDDPHGNILRLRG